MFDAFKRLLSTKPTDDASKKGPASTAVTLRKLELARKFPQELPDDVVGMARGEPHDCESCGRTLAEVVITTGGPYGDRAVWDEYPLALDGWQCPGCNGLSFPADLGPEQITQILNAGAEDARAGRLDDAELAFRRGTSSWPKYSPARVNLASIYLDRIRAEKTGENRAPVVARYAREAEAQWRKAMVGVPPPPPVAYLMLGRLLWRLGNRTEGATFLEELLRLPNVPEALRRDARSILDETRT